MTEPRYKAHVPVEQYGFIEIIGEDRDDIIGEYLSVKQAFSEDAGLSTVEWTKLRNSYLKTGTISGDPGDLEKLSKAQRYWVNETKNAFKASN